jgi:signal transduction histidine kinase
MAGDFSIRTIWLALLLVTTILVFGLTYRTAWRAMASREELSGAQLQTYRRAESECHEIGDRTLSVERHLNLLLYRWVSTGDKSAFQRFQNESQQFTEWVATRRDTVSPSKLQVSQPAPITIDVRSVLEDVRNAMAAYLTATAPAVRARAVPEYENALTAGQQLVVAANRALQQAEAIHVYENINNEWRTSYRNLVGASLLVLAGSAVWLLLIVYRAFFVPMRRKLVESTMIIEKQRKLAHFGELAAGLAHEIRNPLTAINACLYTLQRSLPAKAAAREEANVIAVEIDRLDRIVNDFLRLARPAEPQLASVTARALMEEIARLLSPALREKKIEIKLAGIDDQPFSADPAQLKQVLINIIQNATEAISREGVVTLSAQREDRKLRGKTQPVVVLTVADTGPGIRSEVMEHLFDPFYSTKDNGTGLGLSISARIVEQHGGMLECQSELGAGATFAVILPAPKA